MTGWPQGLQQMQGLASLLQVLDQVQGLFEPSVVQLGGLYLEVPVLHLVKHSELN
jgi:hypothetical protein